MTIRGDDGGQTRGSDGKMYDSGKQADRGYQAHENRVETAMRRTKWKTEDAIGAGLRFPARVYGLLKRGCMGLMSLCTRGMGGVSARMRRSDSGSKSYKRRRD